MNAASKSRIGLAALAAGLMAALGACAASPTAAPLPEPAEILSIEPADVTLQVGQTQRFTATVLDRFENPVPYVVTAKQEAGRLGSEGTFTAGNQVGTYPDAITVVGTAVQDGITRSATASVTVVPAQATGLSAEWGHTCAVTSYGGVMCWGSNEFGKLTDGTTTDFRDAPAGVVGLTSGIVAVSAAPGHSCALTTAGGVKCWGYNADGMLGDGTREERAAPVDVVGLSSGVAAVSSGEVQNCVVTTEGGVKCWGFLNDSQRGSGEPSLTPVDVVGLEGGVAAVSVGRLHTCVLTVSGGVKCWGTNRNGQLGNGTTTKSAVPVDVVGLTSGVTTISARSNATCAITRAGGVKCWGALSEFMNYASGTNKTPIDVVGLAGRVTAVSVGYQHMCAVTTAGGLKCWGSDKEGQIGDGPRIEPSKRSTPVDVVGLTGGVASVATGMAHTCAAMVTGEVKCWGSNGNGMLGDGRSFRSTTPVDVAGLTGGVVAVAASPSDGISCAVTRNGGVKCWGVPYYLPVGGLTGDSTLTNVIGFGSGVADIAAGYGHFCVLTEAGGVGCWERGAWDRGPNHCCAVTITPKDATRSTSGFVAVATGGSHTCAVTIAAGVKCWGTNTRGQLGDGTRDHREAPVDVVGLTSVVAVSTGNQHSCAVTTSGAVMCWGLIGGERPGRGGPLGSVSPVEVDGLGSGAAAVSSGNGYACALTTAGAVKCWGYNNAGQLGQEVTSLSYSATPVDIVGLSSGVASISTGNGWACAVTIHGGVKCWGSNFHGVLGDGTTTRGLSAVDVIGLTSGVAVVSAGGGHTCAVTTAGGVKCWGSNSGGALGDNRPWYQTAPVDVVGFTSDAATVAAADAVTGSAG